MSGLNSTERVRLIKILGKLGSEFPNERAAAGLLATRLLKERGLSWDAVVAPLAWKTIVRQCLQHKHLLSPEEARYCANLELLDSLSPIQVKTLGWIAKTLRAAGVAI
jgi:hypothetical protein